MKIQKNVLLKNYTTFRIGGPAEYFCIAKSKEDLIKAINFAQKNKTTFFILGGGSNLLVSDNGYNGLVIKIENCKLKISARRQAGKICKVIAGAGVTLAKLVSATANASLSGMEWATGIPGATVGGAIRGNAGAFGTEMKDITKTVTVLEIRNSKFEIRKFNNEDCQFGYRDSIFKKNSNLIILSAELEFKKGDKEEIKNKVKEILNYRRSSHPKYSSAGSIFKNLENARARDLIEKASLKGKIIGKAQISEQHANFIVNLGGAKAKDVLKLIDLVKKEVKNKFRIEIEEEIQILS
ncbi:MAG: UDP-N-acetylmuramate dehydrogenase [Candidatus Nealsonbacteria bacterium]|nr:UDP-N-acetylmuramate dehydrogenase [Candidatus Nealsonbacteria bacterium]